MTISSDHTVVNWYQADTDLLDDVDDGQEDDEDDEDYNDNDNDNADDDDNDDDDDIKCVSLG